MRRPTALLAVASVFFLACGLGVRADAQATVAANDFAYTGDKGPAFWAQSADAPACAPSPTGKQSPIDISNVVVDPKLPPLDLNLDETSYVLTNPGYNVRAMMPQTKQTFVVNGEPYKLVEFHFHTLSEHTVNGRQGVMELHAVFQDEDDTKPRLAVIGVIYKIGRPNPFLGKLLAKGLPQKSTSPRITVGDIDLADAFPTTSSYYTYAGSLTTPKCGENVQFFVLRDWAELSPQQFETFHNVVGNNFRPLQARNGRVIRRTAR